MTNDWTFGTVDFHLHLDDYIKENRFYLIKKKNIVQASKKKKKWDRKCGLKKKIAFFHLCYKFQYDDGLKQKTYYKI